MLKRIKNYILPISMLTLIFGTSIAPKANAAITAGADIYCFMRKSGNDHPASWAAAYQFIKQQKPGLFKTSPKQAATMIVELVVQDPDRYSTCSRYLGDLFTGETTKINQETDVTPLNSDDNKMKTPKGNYIDRYNY